MANEFNNFFVNIASNLKEPVTNSNSNHEKLREFCEAKLPAETKFTIPIIQKEKFSKFLSNIDINMATGIDMIGPRLLKLAAPFIADVITFICNHSITNSVFPSKWKEAKVTPFIKMVPIRISIIIAPFRFCLSCLKCLKNMFMRVSQSFYININYYTKHSLVSEHNIHVKPLL